MLLSIQKGTVVCVCWWGGGEGVFLWHVLFQILRYVIFGNLAEFCITDAITTTVKFFW